MRAAHERRVERDGRGGPGREAHHERADSFIAELADVIAGRLRKGRVSASTLAALKRELEDYNIRTGKWKK